MRPNTHGEGRAALAVTLTATFARQVAAAGIQLVTAVLLARYLGAADYGRYMAAQLIPVTLSSLLSSGLPTSLAFFAAREPGSFVVVARRAAWFWVVTTAAAVLVTSVLISTMGARLFPSVGERALWWALASFAPLHLAALANGILQGAQAFRALNLSLLVPPSVTVVIVVVGFWWFGGSTELAVVAWSLGHLAGGVTSASALAWCWRQRRGATAPISRRWFWGYGSTTQVSAVLASVRHRVAHYLVLLIGGPAATGVYALAAQLAERLWLLPQAVHTVLLPVLSSRDAAGADDRQRAIAASTRIVVLACLAAGSAMWLLVALFGEYVFGSSFEGLKAPLAVLLVGTAVHSVTRTVGTYFAATDRPRINVQLSSLGLGAIVLAGLALVPPFGALGAALASTVSYFLPSLLAVQRFSEGEPSRAAMFRPRLGDLGLVWKGVRRSLTHLRRGSGSAG